MNADTSSCYKILCALPQENPTAIIETLEDAKKYAVVLAGSTGKLQYVVEVLGEAVPKRVVSSAEYRSYREGISE